MYSCDTFSSNLVPIGSRQIEFLSNSFLLVRSQLDATIRIVRIEIANASRYFAASFNRLLYQQLQCGSISREKRSADICTAIFVHNGTKNVDTKGKREIAMHLYLRVQRVSALHQRSNLFKCRDEKNERLKFGKKKSPLFFLSTPFFPNKLAFEKDQRSKCSSKFLTFNDVMINLEIEFTNTDSRKDLKQKGQERNRNEPSPTSGTPCTRARSKADEKVEIPSEFRCQRPLSLSLSLFLRAFYSHISAHKYIIRIRRRSRERRKKGDNNHNNLVKRYK